MTQARILPVLGLLLAATLTSACGDSDDRGVLPVDRYCEARAAACESLVPCCEAQGRTSDLDTCREAMIAECEADLAAATAAKARYDSRRAVDCVLELDGWFSSCELPEPSPAVCEEVFQPSPRGSLPLLSYCELIANGS